MTETEIAKELMKGCRKRFECFFGHQKWFESCGYMGRLCPTCQAKISTQLEANKRFLEFLNDLVSKNMEGKIDGNESEEIKKILDKYRDLQQSIKILEGKGEK
jgi:ribosomal protein S17E